MKINKNHPLYPDLYHSDCIIHETILFILQRLPSSNKIPRLKGRKRNRVKAVSTAMVLPRDHRKTMWASNNNTKGPGINYNGIPEASEWLLSRPIHRVKSKALARVGNVFIFHGNGVETPRLFPRGICPLFITPLRKRENIKIPRRIRSAVNKLLYNFPGGAIIHVNGGNNS